MSDAKFGNHPDSRCAGREGTGRTGGRVWPGVCTTRWSCSSRIQCEFKTRGEVMVVAAVSSVLISHSSYTE
jgi:hypothetical protein